MLTINTIKKEKGTDNLSLRKEEKIPAVFYGPKEETTSVIINEIEFLKVYREAGESSIITLKIGDESHEALIHDVQWDAVTQKPLHADFYVIEKGKKVEVAIPLEFIGESIAVQRLGGNLVKVMHEIEIEALPKDLPQHIEVDISSLVDFDAQIKASDLKLPEGVALLVEPEEVVALVQEQKEEVEEETGSIEDIEVQGEKKNEENSESAE